MNCGRGCIARRLAPSAVLFAALLLFTALWLSGARTVYFALFRLLGLPAFRFPFLDTHGELAVIDCHRQGLDVYLTNPCDVLGRVHVYTPLWYSIDWLPVSTADTTIVGLTLAAVFALSLLLLPAARTWRAVAIRSLAVLSPSVGFALERGNADLLMFTLAAIAGWLALRTGTMRLLAYPVILFATALKIYPATLLILALRERWRICLLVVAVSVAALLAYVACEWTGLREMFAVVPGGTPFIYAFGARDLATGIALLDGTSAPAIIAECAVMLGLIATVLLSQRIFWNAANLLSGAERVFLLIGAVLIGGCFILGQSGEYRAVHLLFVLPALSALSCAAPTRRLAAITLVMVLVQLWGDLVSGLLDVCAGIAPGDITYRVARLLWVLRELGWWWIIAVLLALVLALIPSFPPLALLRWAPLRGRR